MFPLGRLSHSRLVDLAIRRHEKSSCKRGLKFTVAIAKADSTPVGPSFGLRVILIASRAILSDKLGLHSPLLHADGTAYLPNILDDDVAVVNILCLTFFYLSSLFLPGAKRMHTIPAAVTSNTTKKKSLVDASSYPIGSPSLEQRRDTSAANPETSFAPRPANLNFLQAGTILGLPD